VHVHTAREAVLPYWPVRLHRLAESIPGLLKSLKILSLHIHRRLLLVYSCCRCWNITGKCRNVG
jgi:hypothetical protein